jgi:hypothetical protein
MVNGVDKLTLEFIIFGGFFQDTISISDCLEPNNKMADWLTNYVELSMTQDATSCAANLPNPISTRSILMFSTHLHPGLPSGLFPSGFPTSNLYAFLFSRICATWCDHIIFDFIILITLGEDYNHADSHYAVFSDHPLLHPSLVQILSSAPFSNTPSVYVPPLMSETKFHTHTEPQFLSSLKEDEKREGSEWNGSKHYPNSLSF